MKKFGFGVFLLVGILLLSACATTQPTPTPIPTPIPVESVAAGQQLFIDNGCVSCHGQNAEGTDIALALPGHNKEQVKRAVRSPVGSMPRFGLEQISDDELEMIADYIESLVPVAEHREPVAMEAVLVVHHWMVLYALEADNRADAEDHLRHILELVTDPEHKAQMEEVMEQVQAGDLHDVSHAIEGIMVEKAEPGLSLEDLHLQLVLAAFEAGELEDARDHLEHFVDLVTGDEKVRGEEIIDLLEQGNIHDAEHEVEELLE